MKLQRERKKAGQGRPWVWAALLFWPLVGANGSVPAGWELVWADEFEGTGAPDPTKWTPEIGAGGWGNQERQTYTDSLENVRQEGGNLVIEVQQDVSGRAPSYSSARLITREKGQWKYGRFEVRAQLPRATGTWPAIWLLASDTKHSTAQWPDNGEIDIMEAVGYEQDPVFKAMVGDPELPNIHGSTHTVTRNTANPISGSTYLPTAYDSFHTYGLTWTEDQLSYDIDGDVYFTISKEEIIPRRNPPDDLSPWWPFDQRFFMILNVAVGGTWGGHFNTNLYPDSPYGANGIDHEAEWPQRMLVDYVRVYAPPPDPATTNLPGVVGAESLAESEGILIRALADAPAPHALHEIDAGDTATFVVESGAGSYALSGLFSATAAGKAFTLEVLETGSRLEVGSLTLESGSGDWRTSGLGAVLLSEGSNTVKITALSSDFEIASLEFTGSSGIQWGGWLSDGSGNINTENWVGWINASNAPWIYSYKLDGWFFAATATTTTFPAAGEWIYLPR